MTAGRATIAPPHLGDTEPDAAARVPVLLPYPLAGTYDYRVKPGLAVEKGSFVAAPLGSRLVPGVVWDGAPSAALDEKRLRMVEDVLPTPPMPEELRRFVDWVAGYTLTSPGAVLRMTMSVNAALEPPRPTTAVAITERGRAARGHDAKLTPQRRRVLQIADDGPARTASELAREAGCGSGVVRGLVDSGLLETVLVPARARRPVPDWRRASPPLSPAQREAASVLARKVRHGGFSVTLIDGVTGSGKTEVYFEAIATALERRRQVLVLLPEIALSAQFMARFAERFGCAPAEWHSDLGGPARRAAWRDIAEGRARVVVGARSALFLPFPELGLVVVDEEHDASYKQEDGVIYQARDMAVARGHIAQIPIVLASATPSLETLHNVEQGRYERVVLPARYGGAALPSTRVADLRRTPPERQRFLAPPLVEAVGEALAAGDQAMLFLNRRGYAPLTLCRACGHRLQCPNCTAWLIEHRFTGRLQCHHCGHAEPIPGFCSNCGATGSFAACGPGIERIAEEVQLRWPDARRAVMASDTLTGPRAAAALVRDMQHGEIDILIGTQVMAKGHHFPKLTLVGVVDADLGLAGGDLRAAERTYQLLHQVAGRAGRAERPGTVWLQTWIPDNPVVAALAAGDRDRFLAAEAEARQRHGMPPFGRLAALIISSGDNEEAELVARAFARAAPLMPGIEVLGPAPAPLALLRGRHRRRFLVKARKDVHLQAVLRQWLERVKVPGSARVQVDIDPYSFL
jgi:primosomal protein N' (replication factor Y)